MKIYIMSSVYDKGLCYISEDFFLLILAETFFAVFGVS